MILAGFHSTFTIPLIASLTENLDDISLRCNPTSSMPEWKKRGADTWNPFNSGYGIFTANFGVGTMNIKYFKQDGSIATASTTYGTSGTAYEDSEIKVDYASGYEGSTARYYITFSVDAKKAGYYMKTLDSSTPVSVESVAVGDTIKAYTAYYPQSGEGIAPIMFIYLGETNPFE